MSSHTLEDTLWCKTYELEINIIIIVIIIGAMKNCVPRYVENNLVKYLVIIILIRFLNRLACRQYLTI